MSFCRRFGLHLGSQNIEGFFWDSRVLNRMYAWNILPPKSRFVSLPASSVMVCTGWDTLNSLAVAFVGFNRGIGGYGNAN